MQLRAASAGEWTRGNRVALHGGVGRPASHKHKESTMAFSKLSLSLCALEFGALLSSVSDARAPALAPAIVAPVRASVTDGGGDQVNTSQSGDLSLVNNNGETTTMSGITKDSDGNVTGSKAGLTSYEWDKNEKRYNPTVIEMNYYEFERLSPKRYEWTKYNASGGVMDSGSLDT